MMPTAEEPSPQLQVRLDVIFGGRERWESIYHAHPQLRFWGEQPQQRAVGGDAIAKAYRERLESVFVQIAPTRKTLKNSNESPLFDLFFGASNARGARRAIPIADHILRNW